MLRLAKLYLYLITVKVKRGFGVLPVMFVLVSIFSPFISMIAFYSQFDEHIVECQYERQHVQDCQANCILQEMLPEQPQATPEKTISFDYIFTDLFLQRHQLIQTSQPSDILVNNTFSHYLLYYAQPTIGIHSPPPKLG